MAIAITLLVLEIAVPHHSHQSLLHGLLREWPSYIRCGDTCNDALSCLKSNAMPRSLAGKEAGHGSG